MNCRKKQQLKATPSKKEKREKPRALCFCALNPNATPRLIRVDLGTYTYFSQRPTLRRREGKGAGNQYLLVSWYIIADGLVQTCQRTKSFLIAAPVHGDNGLRADHLRVQQLYAAHDTNGDVIFLHRRP